MFHGHDELVDDRYEPGVHYAGGCPVVEAECRREFVAAHGTHAEYLIGHLSDLYLMLGVADAQISRYCKAVYLPLHASEEFLRRLRIQGFCLPAPEVVPSADDDLLVGMVPGIEIVAYGHEPYAASPPLDYGVGGQGRRQGYDAHLGQHFIAEAFDRPPYPYREVFIGSRRFVRCQNLPGINIHYGCVCVGAARIDS